MRKSCKEILDEIKSGSGEGTLTLCINCTKCDSYFDLSHESIAMAMAMGVTFIKFLKYIQEENCPKCGKQESDDRHEDKV